VVFDSAAKPGHLRRVGGQRGKHLGASDAIDGLDDPYAPARVTTDLDIDGGGPAADLCQRSGGDPSACIEDHGMGTHGLDLAQDVRRDEHRVFRRQLAHQIPDDDDLVWVEAGGRLVQQDDGWPSQDRIGDPNALTVSPGQMGDGLVRHVGDGQGVHRERDLPTPEGAAHALEFGAETQVFGDAHLGVEGHGLGHVTDVPPGAFRIAIQVDAGNGDRARRLPKKPGANAQGRGLARAIGTKESAGGTGGDLERKVVEDLPIAVIFDEVADLQQGAECLAPRAPIAAIVLALAVGCSRPAPVEARVAASTELEASGPPDAQKAAAPGAGATDAGTNDGAADQPIPDAVRAITLDMLPVPGGPFTMGADQGGEGDERPAHTVVVQPFWLDRTEVTNASYTECVRAKECSERNLHIASITHSGKDEEFFQPDKPVVGVSWDQARAYCRFRGKRLPTEAEFEKAARGTEPRRFPWGNDAPTAEHAVFGRWLGHDSTDPVGKHPKGRGPYGHDDMAGNVWEWIEDFYDPYAYRRPGAPLGVPGTCDQILSTQDELRAQGKRGFTGTNPIPTECEHVLRGGAFNYPADGLRVTNRVHHPGRYRLVMSGLRCAKDGPIFPTSDGITSERATPP
jgi:formylglycine-generating enzyme required for sulfatase activity